MNMVREVCVNYFSGVDHGTLDQGASLLTTNRLSSVMDSQSRIKGITCCCCYFFVILFYFLSVIRLLPLVIGFFVLLYVLECLFRFRDQRFFEFV